MSVSNLHRLISGAMGLAIFGTLCVYLPMQFSEYADSKSTRAENVLGDLMFIATTGALMLPIAAAIWHPFRPVSDGWHYRLSRSCVALVLALPLGIWNALLERAGHAPVNRYQGKQESLDIGWTKAPEQCRRCGGRKWIDAANMKRGDFSSKQECPSCGGSGNEPRLP